MNLVNNKNRYPDGITVFYRNTVAVGLFEPLHCFVDAPEGGASRLLPVAGGRRRASGRGLCATKAFAPRRTQGTATGLLCISAPRGQK